MEEGIGGRIPAPHYSLLHYDDDQNDVGENLVRGDIRFRPEDEDVKHSTRRRRQSRTNFFLTTSPGCDLNDEEETAVSDEEVVGDDSRRRPARQ